MRACVIGGGLAGSLLAWRLAQASTAWEIDLVLGHRAGGLIGGALPGAPRSGSAGADATAASGGAVRAYETNPEQRRLAIASMVELLASQTLRRWARFRPVTSVYVRHGAGTGAGTGHRGADHRGADELRAAIADIDQFLPDSAEVIGADELRHDGWAGLPDDAVAVRERHAGYTAPGHWRDSILGDGTLRRRVSIVDSAAGQLGVAGDLLTCSIGGRAREYDVVVVAAGAWTAAVLAGSGLGTGAAGGYRTKSIQYAVHPVGDWSPSIFVDETTGLYGRPTDDGGLLLGLPTQLWDVDPDRAPYTPELGNDAARLARERFPRLRLGPPSYQVGSADCYTAQPVLSLRPVLDSGHRLFTFSGGAGGSIKTALAASHRAAIQLVEPGRSSELTSVGRRKGQP